MENIKQSHQMGGYITMRCVTVNKRYAGFPTSVIGVGWGYPAKGAEG